MLGAAAFIFLVLLVSASGAEGLQSLPALMFVRQPESGDMPPTTTPAPPPKTPDCTGTCEFNNGVATQFLMLCDGSCVCAAKLGMLDTPSFNPIWNGTICTVSESGPCGKDESGMVMACQPGLTCIEKRCRDPTRIGTLEVGWACDDSLDCQSGLACVSDENSLPIRKACRVLPKSLFRIW